MLAAASPQSSAAVCSFRTSADMITSSRAPARLACTVLLIFGGPGGAASGLAQPPPIQLEPVVTTATRTGAEIRTIGSAVEVIAAADLARRQVHSLAGALGGIAGAPHFASGAPGALASVFLRGANSNQALFLVDGIRLNDPNTDYAVWLGGAPVSPGDSVEIARGPQSTLYGAEAVGGVVALRARRGAGVPAGSIGFEVGSFGTVRGTLAAEGERGRTAFNLSAHVGHTDNERANNGFDSSQLALRVDRAIHPRLATGATLRWFHGAYGDPGDRHTNDPDNRSREDNLLATAFADFRTAGKLTGRILLGGQDRRYVSENPSPGAAAQITEVRNRRAVLDAQATYSGVARHRITGGATLEGSHARNTGFGDVDEQQRSIALFAQDEYSPREDVFFTLGLRHDDFETFGRATTGRATAAWLPSDRRLKLRATYGTGFRSPSFLDLFGRSSFYHGNPALRPERARGWDAGMDYYLPRQAGVLSATWFETRLADLITSTADFRSVENIQRARTRGCEVSMRAETRGGTALRGSYTWLEAVNLTAGTRLLRRPRHQAAVDMGRDVGRGVNVGAGLAWTAGREDVDAATFATIAGEDFTVVRVYGAWEVSQRITLRLRFENLLDESYEEVNGYPALGFGAFARIEWRL